LRNTVQRDRKQTGLAIPNEEFLARMERYKRTINFELNKEQT